MILDFLKLFLMDVVYEREPHKADDIFWVTIVSSLKINPQLDRSSDNAKKIKLIH